MKTAHIQSSLRKNGHPDKTISVLFTVTQLAMMAGQT